MQRQSPNSAAAPGPVVVAFGGNALQRSGERGSVDEMRVNLRAALHALAPLLRSGAPLVITHGNGPQVGSALLRSEAAADQVPAHPLDIAVATTQAEIGSLAVTELALVLAELGEARDAVALVTHVEVADEDPALRTPTKPVGPFYDEATAESLRRGRGWHVVEDAGRGWRRVVGSPRPRSVVEIAAIRSLLRAGTIVVACGGGGIPVARSGDRWTGVEAVIDKDRTAALLGEALGAAQLIVLTAVDAVYEGFGTDAQRALRTLDVAAAEALVQSGTLPAGSMAPKVEACAAFVRATGRSALITSEEALAAALRGEAGTRFA